MLRLTIFSNNMNKDKFKRQFLDFKLIRLVVLICVAIIIGQSNTIAQNIYISTSGNDALDGSTPELAIKTLSKLQGTAVPNDSIFFKKGDIWKGESWFNVNSNLYIGTYGEGELPIVTSRDTIKAAMNSLNWQNTDSLWYVDIGGFTTRLFLDDIEHLRAQDSLRLGKIDSQDSVGKWYVTNNTLYMISDSNPTNHYSLFEGNKFSYAFLFSGANNCHIDSIKLEGGNLYSLWLSNSDSTVIKHCEFGKDARGGILLNNGSDYNLIDSSILDSYFEQNYGYALDGAASTDRGVGDGINLNNNASHNTISNITCKNWSHNALEISHDKNTLPTDSTNHNKFVNITIDASEIPYAHPFGADGPKNRCSYNEWAYINVNNCKTAIQVNGNHNHVHNSILQNFKQSPAKPTVSAPAIWCAVYESTSIDSNFVYNVSEHNLFENLLIFNIDESAIRLTDFGYENRVVHNITFRNCLIINPGLNPINPLNNEYNEGTAIYFDDVGTIDSIFFEGNLFFQDSLTNDITLHLSNSNQYLDFDSINVLNNEFGISSNQNLNVNPELVGQIPSEGSVAINSGLNASSQPEIDFLGNPRNVDGRIDIGPFENQILCQDGAIRYVDADAIGAENGTSWTDAYKTVYDALEDCPATNKNEIWVAEGIYYPTSSLDSSFSISLPSSTILYGGWEGNEFAIGERVLNQYLTILSGDIGVQDDSTDNSVHVITQDGDSLVVIDGVTIQDGFGADRGAGINVQNSQLQLVNLVIRDNVASEASHIYLRNSEVFIENVVIGNTTSTVDDIIFDHMSKVFIANFLNSAGITVRGAVEIKGILEGN